MILVMQTPLDMLATAYDTVLAAITSIGHRNSFTSIVHSSQSQSEQIEAAPAKVEEKITGRYELC